MALGEADALTIAVPLGDGVLSPGAEPDICSDVKATGNAGADAVLTTARALSNPVTVIATIGQRRRLHPRRRFSGAVAKHIWAGLVR